jgi:hypothetical protein
VGLCSSQRQVQDLLSFGRYVDGEALFFIDEWVGVLRIELSDLYDVAASRFSPSFTYHFPRVVSKRQRKVQSPQWEDIIWHGRRVFIHIHCIEEHGENIIV